MKTNLKTIACLSFFFALATGSVCAQTWDVTADWNPPANPNGAWSYGAFSGGVVTPLAWTPTTSQPDAIGVYSVGAYCSSNFYGPYVYQNTNAAEYYGIEPGQISLQASYANVAIQWTAPTGGLYNLAVYIGGTTAGGLPAGAPFGPGGYANTYAQWAGLNINGDSQADTSFVSNDLEIVKSWIISDVSLHAGDTVVAYIINPGYAFGGDTQVKFSITNAPTPPAQTWDVTADWNPPANPNGAWSYGEINSGVFTPMAWTPVPGDPIPNCSGLYGNWPVDGAIVYQNTNASEYYGIEPGQISVNASYGNAAVQWTAPATGEYNLAVYLGGTTAGGLPAGIPYGPGGYANTYAQWAGLNINGDSQADTAFVNNASEIMKSWVISDVSLHAGDTVIAYIINPGYAFGGDTQAKFTITEVAPPPPAILNQPQGILVEAQDSASFSVFATGSTPLFYQWSLNGTNIFGATNNMLTITNVTQTDLGSYSVVAANAYGSVTSSNATLSMYPFLAGPFGGVVTDWGQNAILSVQAWGTGPLSFQWYDNGAAIPNATNQTLDLSSIQFTNAGLYSVVVSSPLGSVTNTPEQVVVNPAGVSLGMYPGVTVTGTVGYTYTIQATADLSNTNSWVSVATITLQESSQLWVDINANALSPSNPHKFYRVIPGE